MALIILAINYNYSVFSLYINYIISHYYITFVTEKVTNITFSVCNLYDKIKSRNFKKGGCIMKSVKNFFIETVVLTVTVIGWGILKLLRFVKAQTISNDNKNT